MASDLGGYISFKEKSIAALFFNMADKNPEKIALWCDGEELTYQELNSLVCRYANYLASRGVDKDRIVTAGHGSRIPNEDLEREEMRRDRRVEIKVVYNENVVIEQ